ncbi:hypothetical protein [Streptomyces niveus]|uniref:hypothetical protein n=1 Tax=Streptomyces niveus TaxID=193462 RepID=UPI0003C575EE|nr:hypothetical protein [Streptomyces niveus]EST18108.1 hypothetical protein M877_39475 [Streptomyces niveus NCIMB 11891]
MPDTPSPDFSQLDGGDEQQAMDAVQKVVAWYNKQIAAAYRAPVPDEERIAELKAAREKATGDQARLESAGPEETARIAAAYAALLKDAGPEA